MVAFYRPHLLCVFLVILITYYSHQDDSMPVDGNTNWEIVEKGWPLPDVSNPNSQFVYLKSKNYFKVTINPDTIKDTAEVYKVTFKYWAHYQTERGPTQAIVDIDTNAFDAIYQRYSPFLDRQWMPLEYILSKDQLNTFGIEFTLNDNNLVAFKDFKLEYETNTITAHTITGDKKDCDYQKFDTNNNNHWPLNDKCVNVLLDFDQQGVQDHQIKVTSTVSEPTEVVVTIAGLKDSIQNTIFKLFPEVGEANHKFALNLKHFIAIYHGQANLTFTVKNTTSEAKTDIKVEIVTLTTTDIPASSLANAPNFLLPMAESDWNKQWITPSGAFSLNTDSIKIKVDSKTWHPTNEFLVSHWIKYDVDAMHSQPMRYSVEVTDPRMWNGFRIRPKVCDELGHCVDVYVTSPTTLTTGEGITKQTIGFQFPKLTANFIKLVVELEYYKPAYIDLELGSITAKFKLEHFGDPCSIFTTNPCLHDGYCESDPNTSTANKLICTCDRKYAGDSCEKKDPCNNLDNAITPGSSGAKTCSRPNILGECIAIDDSSYKCSCVNIENKLFWDVSTKTCSDFSTPPEYNWKFDNSAYYPEKVESEIIYSLGKVDTDGYAYCFDFDYMTTLQLVPLTVTYNKDKQNTFTYYLPKDQTNFKICTNDFIQKLTQDSDIRFTVTDDKVVNDPVEFHISKMKVTKIDDKNSKNIKYMNWQGDAGERAGNQAKVHWNVFPSNLAPANEMKDFTWTVTAGVDYRVMLVSNWIDADKDILRKLSQIETTIDTGSTFAVTVTAMYWNNNQLQKIQPIQNSKDKFEKLLGLPSENGPYKLLIEIIGSTTDPTKKATIKNVLIGDGCHDMDGKSICQKTKGCKPALDSSSKEWKFVCQCGPDFSGPMCEFPNKCNANDAKTNCASYLSTNKIDCTHKTVNYECMCMDKYFNWDQSSSSCVRSTAYETKQMECTAKDCNVLSGMDSHQKWSDKDLPVMIKNYDNVPVYYTTTKDEQIVLKLTKSKQNEDMCFTINYFVTENSKIHVGYNGNGLLPLTKTMTSDKDDKWRYQDICLYDLTTAIDATSKLVFKSEINAASTVAFHIVPKSNLKDTSKYSIDFIELDKKSWTEKFTQNHWTFSMPGSMNNVSNEENHWSVNNNGKIIFAVPKPTDKTKKKIYSSTLMSTWIIFTKGMNLRLAHDYTKFEKLAISAYVLDSTLKLYPIANVYGDRSINDKAINETQIEFEIPEVPYSFRVALVSTYNNSLDATVTFSGISLGDPCVEGYLNKTYPKSVCNGNPCKRNKAMFDYKCDCGDKFDGTDCENKNWCKREWPEFDYRTGNTQCANKQSGTCQVVNHDTFTCDCGKDSNKYFDFTGDLKEQMCRPVPKCLTHKCPGDFQICHEPQTSDQSAYCICDDDHIDVKNDTANPQCVLYKPCDEQHRKIKMGASAIDQCHSNTVKDITCLDVGNQQKCVCPAGYHDVLGKLNFPPQCVANDKCNYFQNDCEQHCSNNQCLCGDSYDLQKDGKCLLKTGKTCSQCTGGQFCDVSGCNCKDNQSYNKTSKACENSQDDIQNQLKSSQFKYLCPTGLVTKTDKGEFECDCGPGYKWLNKQCVHQPLCADKSEGRTKCAAVGAMCVIDDKLNLPFCKCPDRTVGIFENTTLTKCVNYCDYGSRGAICDDFHADCDPRATIDLDKDLIANPPKTRPGFCRCKPGTNPGPDGICQIGKNLVRFTLELENKSPDSQTLSQKINVQVFKSKSDSTDSDYTLGISTEKQKYDNVYDINNFVADIKSTEAENLKLINSINDKLKYITNEDRNLDLARSVLSSIYPGIKRTTELNSLAVTGCKTDNPLNCDYIIDLRNKYDDPATALNEQNCIKIPNDDNHCFVNVPAVAFATKSYIIMVNKATLSTAKFAQVKGCDLKDNVCNQGVNAYCVPDPTNNSPSNYKCECNPDYFTSKVKPTRPFGTTVYDCTPLASDVICSREWKGCSKDVGQCVITDSKMENNKRVLTSQCYCNQDHKWDDKAKQCVAACGDQNCNGHGTCKVTGVNGWQCVCNEGYYGDSCNSEQTFAKAGWIAGIVVLAVLVVVISGVAYMFARRSRSNGDSYSGNMGMNDYPVARSGAQSRGQSNPSFHRD